MLLDERWKALLSPNLVAETALPELSDLIYNILLNNKAHCCVHYGINLSFSPEHNLVNTWDRLTPRVVDIVESAGRRVEEHDR